MDSETLDIDIILPDKVKVLLVLVSIFCLGSFAYFIKNFTSGYSLESFGNKFNKSWYSFWSKYGLRRSDYMKFKINIRTFDASEDCKIHGKFKNNKLTNLYIHGSGEKCQELRKNKKI
tara:strand:+ start:1735 stop:2088 length:354 start_codon:yes stop_codon:yes gene_type:complete